MCKHLCPVCGQTEFDDDFDICNVCGWEHDFIGEEYPDELGGPNEYTLNEYRRKFQSGWRPDWLDGLYDD